MCEAHIYFFAPPWIFKTSYVLMAGSRAGHSDGRCQRDNAWLPASSGCNLRPCVTLDELAARIPLVQGSPSLYLLWDRAENVAQAELLGWELAERR